jgi:filamentous hemagglutinin
MAFEKNVGLAGTRHPMSGIVFDTRGFPIFDDVARFDTRISSKISSVENSGSHMRAATRDLREAISRGEVSESQFTAAQLRAIQAGKAKIPDLTWHHHQDIGRMQLIPTKVHRETGHIGGYEMWFR